jgi:hypothetical protein
MWLRHPLDAISRQLRGLVRLWPLLLAFLVGIVLPLTIAQPMALDAAVAWIVILAASHWLAGQDGFVGSLGRRFLGTPLWSRINGACLTVLSRLLGSGRLVSVLCSALSSYTAMAVSLLFESWLGSGDLNSTDEATDPSSDRT